MQENTSIPDKTIYTNASFTLAGAACAVMLAGSVLHKVGHVGGLHHLSYLCYPLLACWAGILLRRALPSPRWWVRGLVLCAAAAFLYLYRGTPDNFNWDYRQFLCLAAAALGYLVPPEELRRAGDANGADAFAMTAVSAFCFAAVHLVKERLSLHFFIPDHPGMEALMESAIVVAEPLMVLPVLHFAVRFSFSKAGMAIGGKDWARVVLAVPMITVFLTVLVDWIAHPYVMCYHSPIQVLVQPVAVWLVAMLAGTVRKRLKRTKEGTTPPHSGLSTE